MPKVNRNGQAVVLSEEQLSELFATLDQPHRLVFQICYWDSAITLISNRLSTYSIFALNNGLLNVVQDCPVLFAG